ncbi:MAG: bifunctional nuclease family protein [Bacteroidales bacterium]|nr:bifunctional nuclease family protein [Bacteroidales bacterium]
MNYKKVYATEVIQGFTETSLFIMMLYEPLSGRKVPVMIGRHEAEMIMVEQSNQSPKRPMTHQLIINIMNCFALTLKTVRIDRFEEGIFYATLVVSDGFNTHNIDARASDAVLLALHESVDIEMAEDVVNDTGFVVQNDDIDITGSMPGSETIEELEEELRRCEENEEYERAAEIMEKIKKTRNNA